MSLSRSIVDLALRVAKPVLAPRPGMGEPRSIFVLRNNDLGDTLLCTPLFAALHRMFPKARIAAGVGPWAADLLVNNPHVHEVLPVSAPWHNKFTTPPPQSRARSVRYLQESPEVRTLAERRFDLGLDVVGSYEGSLLLLKARMGRRIGVKGYAGGHTACTHFIDFNGSEHVAQAALRLARKAGEACSTKPDHSDIPSIADIEPRAQIFLSAAEKARGEEVWNSFAGNRKRVVIGPTGGFVEKCWPAERYAALIERLSKQADAPAIAIVGGKGDTELGERLAAAATNGSARSFCGSLALRETFALVASAHAVVCNSSMLLHVAGAFHKPSVLLLGPFYSATREHVLQWGYPETVALGPEAASPRLAEPAEAEAALNRFLTPDT